MLASATQVHQIDSCNDWEEGDEAIGLCSQRFRRMSCNHIESFRILKQFDRRDVEPMFPPGWQGQNQGSRSQNEVPAFHYRDKKRFLNPRDCESLVIY